jgi:hypothetical protein
MEGRDVCPIHSGNDATKSAFMSRLGKRGAEVQAQRREAASADLAPPCFETIADVKAWLEGEVGRAQREENPQIAVAAARVASVVVKDVFPLRELQRENKELRALLKKAGVKF